MSRYLDELRTAELIDEIKDRFDDVNDALDKKLDKSDKPYKAGGSFAFADIPAADATTVGLVYNITDDFTTTSDFIEGANVAVAAGSDVVVVAVPGAEEGTFEYKYNLFGGPAPDEIQTITTEELAEMWKDAGGATLDNDTVTVAVNGTETVNVTGATGAIVVTSGDTDVATVAVSEGVITITGIAVGETTIDVAISGTATTRAANYEIAVTVTE